jgi:hypothetical protein
MNIRSLRSLQMLRLGLALCGKKCLEGIQYLVAEVLEDMEETGEVVPKPIA